MFAFGPVMMATSHGCMTISPGVGRSVEETMSLGENGRAGAEMVKRSYGEKGGYDIKAPKNVAYICLIKSFIGSLHSPSSCGGCELCKIGVSHCT